MSLAGEPCAGPPCDAWCPQPLCSSCNEPCVVSCQGSRVIIYPPPVVVTFPGPILSMCPQETLVGSSAVPEGCATSLWAGAGCSEPSRCHEPQRPPRTTYIYASRWIHPCNRPGYLRYSSPASRRDPEPSRDAQEHPPEKEKLKEENTDTENTDNKGTESSSI